MNVDDIWRQVFRHPRPDRAYALQYVIANEPLSQDEINELILFVWEDSENIWRCSDVWEEHWNNYSAPAVKKRLIARLFSQPRLLYRAGDPKGQSWTFSRKVAQFFAMRSAIPTSIHQRVFSADEIITITNGRREQEVIVKKAAE